MTELTFLIELLLNHDLPKPTKDAIAIRIKEVEEKMLAVPVSRQPVHAQVGVPSPAHMIETAPITMPTSQAAMESMRTRQIAQSGKVVHDPNTGRPRKF